MESKKIQTIKTFSIGGILVLAALVVSVAYLYQKYSYFLNRSNHTKNVLMSTQELSKQLLLTERYQRVYAITGLKMYKNSYEQHKRQTDIYAKKITKLVSDNPNQISNIDSLNSLINSRFLYMDTTIFYVENIKDTFQILKTRLSSPIQINAIQTINAQIQKISDIEDNLLKERSESMEKYMNLLYPLIVLLFALGLIIGFLNFYNLYTFNKEREKYLKKIELYQNELQEKINALDNSNKDLEQFAYVASHDLQEPLRKVISFGDLLQESAAENLNDESKMYLNKMTAASQRMRQLITDLLNYSRAGRKNLKTEWVNINDVINEIEDDFNLLIKETKANINKENLPKIFGNRTVLKEVFQNIISNAIKFRLPNISPIISITTQVATQNMINNFGDLNKALQYNLITITDNGIGFEQEFSEKIFVIFQRLHSKESYEGTGIGLAVCKKIIESMGGKIWASSEKNKGTSFFILVPGE